MRVRLPRRRGAGAGRVRAQPALRALPGEVADDPADPETVTGLEAPNFDVDSFGVSHGDPQTVQVRAKRELGLVLLRYRINGGFPRIALTREYDGGEVYYQDDDIYYHRLRGQVRGTEPDDQVDVWFESFDFGDGGLRRERSESFTYEAAVESDNDVLVVAAEDYTGLTPTQTTGPNYADDYIAALGAAGYEADLYDVDAKPARRRTRWACSATTTRWSWRPATTSHERTARSPGPSRAGGSSSSSTPATT